MTTAQIIEPGRYDYDLQVKYEAPYTPEHTPDGLRASRTYTATKTRAIAGRFDLAEHVGRQVIRDSLVARACADLHVRDVQVVRFDLTRVTD